MEPVQLLTWKAANRPQQELLWQGAADDQFTFVAETLRYLLLWHATPEEVSAVDYGHKLQHVIGTHTSKSVLLPVYHLQNAKLGVDFYLRGNFYDWKITVLSKYALTVDLASLAEVADTPKLRRALSSVYFEGFPEDLVRGPYSANHREFSISVATDYHAFTALFLILRAAERAR